MSKPAMARFERNHGPLISLCLGCLALGRTGAALAPTLPAMFAATFFVITAVGVLNTTISAVVCYTSAFQAIGG